MRKVFWAPAACFFLCSFASFATTLITGTPNSSDNATDTPTGLTPKFGTLINFDDQTPNSLLSATAYTASGVSSITDIHGTAALSALPYSSQSYPNYIGPADFSNIDALITLTKDSSEIGIGLLAGISSTFTLEALGDSSNILAMYTVTVPSNGVSAYNGYYAILDSTADIKSLEVIGNGGVDDLQFMPAAASAAPEPGDIGLLGLGLSLLSSVSLYRRKKKNA